MTGAPVDCCNPCQTNPPVNIPGTPGSDGAAGATGAAGANSYTITTANFNLPGAINANVTFLVANSAWAAILENIVASDGTNIGTFQVVSIPSSTSIEGKWLGYPGDSPAGTQINAGALVGPAGYLPATPVTIAQGGTGSTTEATAQVALGLGQDATITNGEAIAYTITNAAATITAITATAPAAGLYLVVGWASVDYAGVTFAGDRTLTLKARNTTAGTDVSTTDRHTETPTTTSYPSLDYHLPYKTVTLALNDIVALQISISIVPSAGTATVGAASLALIPLALS